ncbi:hypothetical protein V7O66_13790 [Methanolobus sp. ZRKC3]|uniref:hypothetical protein n=1 Tax=Methanolobus sp. ZRKC3 TaxID=3125786 RepID=UPI00324D1EDB
MSLITKQDVEDELQLSLPTGYTDAIISTIADTAEDWLKIKTNRTSFTGSAATLATKYVLFKSIDQLLTTNPDLVKTDVKKISENDASVEFFDTGRKLKDYAAEAENILKQLVIRPTGSRYSYANDSTFYN